MPPKKKTKVEEKPSVFGKPLWLFSGNAEGSDGSGEPTTSPPAQTWVPFADADSVLIENEYNNNVEGFVTQDLSFNKGYTTSYAFNFKTYTQLNMDSGKVRKLKRLPKLTEIQWEWEDDHGLFVPYFDEDIELIEHLYRQAALGIVGSVAAASGPSVNATVGTKALSFNAAFDSPYKFSFSASTQMAMTTDGEAEPQLKRSSTNSDIQAAELVTGIQENEDSGRKRKIRRIYTKKTTWDASSYQGAGAPAAESTTHATPVATTATTAATENIGDSGCPPTWTGTIGSFLTSKIGEYSLVDVSPTSAEGKSVILKFESNGSFKNRRIKGIQRNQNVMLWHFYAMHVAHLAKRNDGDANERTTFFGERNQTNFNLILKLGFDCRVVCGIGNGAHNVQTAVPMAPAATKTKKKATFGAGHYALAHGNGLYFGASAVYTDSGRCLVNTDKSKQVIMCRLAAGAMKVGAPGIRRPPPKDPSKPSGDLYDSCVDNEKNPSVHIIFSNPQAYPEYVITYFDQ